MNIAFFGTACAVPSIQSGFTSLLLRTGNLSVLVDAVDNPVRDLLAAGEDPCLLTALVLTHMHVDHLGGLPSLVATLSNMGRTLPLIVMSDPEMRERAAAILHAYGIDPRKLPYDLQFESSGLQRGGASIELLPGRHSVPTQMVYIVAHDARILYTSDIEYEAAFYEDLPKCGILIHESTYFHEDIVPGSGHSSARQAGAAAEALEADKLFLCHLSHKAFSRQEMLIQEARGEFSGEIIIPSLIRWYEGSSA